MPGKKQKHHQPSAAESQRDKQLHRIIEDASSLHRSSDIVTAREVAMLREAFQTTVPPNQRSTHQLAIQCDNLLHQLEKRAGVTAPGHGTDRQTSSPSSSGAGTPAGAAAVAAASAPAKCSSSSSPASAAAAKTATTTTTTTTSKMTNNNNNTKKSKSESSRLSRSWAEDSTVSWKFTDIPLERRLQTMAVTVFCFFTGLPLFITVTGLLLYFEWTRWFTVAYIISMFVFPVRHPTTVRRWWVDNMLFKWARDYFPVRLVIPKQVRKLFDRRRNYLFCYHPHGVHSFGAMLSFGCNANRIYDIMPGFTFHVQTLSIQFSIPFWREMVRWCGLGDASAKTIDKTLNSGPGQCVMLVVGGAEESLMALPNTNDLLLSKRKGFVKLALRNNSPLVPVFGFGETNLYGNYAEGRPWLKKYLAQFQKVVGFALPLIKGRGWFHYNWGPLPHRALVATVVGAPIDMPHIPNPTQADIDKWHAVYVEALMELYREHKTIYDLHAKTEATVVK